MAYWGLRGETLIPTIYDLNARSIAASKSLGRVDLETDDRGYLAVPSWDSACSTATFSEDKLSKPPVALTTKQHR